mmetsp:Transcript_833/g.1281  ORF Transcript_833/g.1281 Transcript_833/m.1281 type:complete len:192 (-) Transcript_833:274-849(-)
MRQITSNKSDHASSRRYTYILFILAFSVIPGCCGFIGCSSSALRQSHVRCTDETQKYNLRFHAKDTESSIDSDDDVSSAFKPSRGKSMLFSPPDNDDDEMNKAEDIPLVVWREVKSSLPRFVHGAKETDSGDDNPLGCIYNLIFVRVPVIGAGVVYAKNLLSGYPLVIDVGQGPFEVNSFFVAACLWVLLL